MAMAPGRYQLPNEATPVEPAHSRRAEAAQRLPLS